MFSPLSQKQKIRAGRKYECYVSWKLRREGWEVSPRTKYGKYDRGIDLIAIKDGKVRYTQCKGWARTKTLYENSIDQLYGSFAYQVGPENMKMTEIFLYSSAQLSDYARDHAKKLGIEFFHEPFPNWYRRKRLYRTFPGTGL